MRLGIHVTGERLETVGSDWGRIISVMLLSRSLPIITVSWNNFGLTREGLWSRMVYQCT